MSARAGCPGVLFDGDSGRLLPSGRGSVLRKHELLVFWHAPERLECRLEPEQIQSTQGTKPLRLQDDSRLPGIGSGEILVRSG